MGCGQDSPLHAAVRGGGADIVDLLMDFGADGCHKNAEGKTPLELSSPNSAVRIALQKRGMLQPHLPYPLVSIAGCLYLPSRIFAPSAQGPALCCNSVGSAFAEVWDGAAYTEPLASAFLTV